MQFLPKKAVQKFEGTGKISTQFELFVTLKAEHSPLLLMLL